MRNTIVITVPSHPKYLSVVRGVTAKVGQILGMDEELVEDIKLAVDEACSNVIKHAYKGDTSKKIVLKYKTDKNRFQVIIEDWGVRADIDSIKGRSLDDVRPGGLGVHLIKRIFDAVLFDEKKKKGNRLILVKEMSRQ